MKDRQPGEIRKGEAVWESKNKTTHWAVGEYIHDRIRLLWTLCRKHDVPANKAWYRRDEDTVDCQDCLKEAKT